MGSRAHQGLVLAAVTATVAWVPLAQGAPQSGPVDSEQVRRSAGADASRACPESGVVRSSQVLQGLLSASSGPTEVFVAGTLRGDFVLRRTLSLHGCEGGALQGSGTRTVLTVEADGVVIDNLRLSGSGGRPTAEDAALKMKGAHNTVRRVTVADSLYGVVFEGCKQCLLEDSSVTGRPVEESLRGDGVKLWEAHESQVRRNRVEGVRDVVVWYSRHVTLEDNAISASRYGTHFMYAHDSVVRRSQLVSNVVGIFFMYSNRCVAEDNVLAGARGPAGMGVGFKESDTATLRRNLLVANTAGMYLDRTPYAPNATVDFADNVVALNTVAVRFHASPHGVSFLRNDFRDNEVLVEVDGGGDALGATFQENFFSDYAGYDLDRDGRGDVPFMVRRSSSQLGDAFPSLRYFHGTAALGLYDAVATAMPFFGSQKMLEDPRPAMRVHRVVAR